MANTVKEIWESLTPEEKEEYLNYEYPPDKEIYKLYPEIRNREKDIKEFYESIEKNQFEIDLFLITIYCFFATYKKDFKRAAYYYNMIPEHIQTEAFLLCFGDLVELFPLNDDEMAELKREIEAVKNPS